MIRLEHVGFTYPSRKEATLSNINIGIGQGERVLIAGRTGCGKSTLLKIINGLIPGASQGQFTGNVWLDGVNTREARPDEIGLVVGTLYQSPDDQIFATTVWDEVAFALENRGIAAELVRERVATVLAQVGLSGYEKRSVHALSGGQRQRLALAAVLATKPSVLVLDEPISQLNPAGAASLLQLLLNLNETEQMTLIVVEHRVHELYRFFPRLIYLEGGAVVYDGAIEQAWQTFERPLAGLREPETVRICRKLRVLPPEADCNRAAGRIVRSYPRFDGRAQAKAANFFAGGAKPVVVAECLSYAYEGQARPVLRELSFCVNEREIVAVMGQNGAGKSTLLSLLAGLVRPQGGSIRYAPDSGGQGGVGLLRQDTDLMLLHPTVGEEVGLRSDDVLPEASQRLLAWLDLAKLRHDFPLALSRGQRLRVALAALLANRPRVLLLDEPTTGQDYESLEDIRRILRAYRYKGGTVLFCTHDVELAAELADRVVLLKDGQVAAQGAARELLTEEKWLQAGGLIPTPLAALCRLLHLPPRTGQREVCRLVSKTALGGG